MNDGSPLKISGNRFSEIKFLCHSHQTELCDRKSEEGKDGGAVDLFYIGNILHMLVHNRNGSQLEEEVQHGRVKRRSESAGFRIDIHFRAGRHLFHTYN